MIVESYIRIRYTLMVGCSPKSTITFISYPTFSGLTFSTAPTIPTAKVTTPSLLPIASIPAIFTLIFQNFLLAAIAPPWKSQVIMTIVISAMQIPYTVMFPVTVSFTFVARVLFCTTRRSTIVVMAIRFRLVWLLATIVTCWKSQAFVAIFVSANQMPLAIMILFTASFSFVARFLLCAAVNTWFKKA